ncbi:hypothetical protein Q1695_003066 [Nippostrongylus brasiliensis]|nr:hypothetical protein Q1695_003066 [Nippostrongylus brasiliensis]
MSVLSRKNENIAMFFTTGESCQRRQIGRFITSMCSPRAPARKQSKGNSEYYCPGGGAVVVGYDGKLLSCDLLRQCSGEHICNPQYGVCCTKIRTCQRPAKTMLNAVTRKPILCQLKFGLMMPCPEGGFCETKTGFCCKSQGVDVTVTPLAKSRPWRGQPCVVREGCEGQAACMCDSRGCQCECPSELGYTVATDGKTCERVRRRLKEKCKTDMECSSAFSECSTGGCRCKKGFQRDGRGGCKPISYHCVNNGQPLDVAGDIVTCSMKASLAKLFFSSRKQKVGPLPTMNSNTGSGSNYSLSDWIPTEQDDCPDEYYCVPLFDDATRPGFYQGFCCPSPGETKPVCPVGEPHETSSPPSFGCKDCPLEYYCHRDAIFTEKSICCPKPCISLEDIYHDGQCYPTAFYGDSCQISAQCSPMRNSTDKYSENSPLDCVKGVCACRTGYSHINGECKRMMCTVGFRGEPSVDRNNQLIVCARSGDCSQGQMCDPNTHVCCKGNNRCPKGYVETGEFCENDNCDRPGALCFRAKSGKAKLCCAVEK